MALEWWVQLVHTNFENKDVTRLSSHTVVFLAQGKDYFNQHLFTYATYIV